MASSLKSSVATLDQSLCQSIETLLRYDGLETKQKSLYCVFVLVYVHLCTVTVIIDNPEDMSSGLSMR
jgi:hypothetical protein